MHTDLRTILHLVEGFSFKNEMGKLREEMGYSPDNTSMAERKKMCEERMNERKPSMDFYAVHHAPNKSKTVDFLTREEAIVEAAITDVYHMKSHKKVTLNELEEMYEMADMD